MFDFFGIEQTSLAGGGGSSNFCREGVGVEEGDPLEEKLTAESSQISFPANLGTRGW